MQGCTQKRDGEQERPGHVLFRASCTTRRQAVDAGHTCEEHLFCSRPAPRTWSLLLSTRQAVPPISVTDEQAQVGWLRGLMEALEPSLSVCRAATVLPFPPSSLSTSASWPPGHLVLRPFGRNHFFLGMKPCAFSAHGFVCFVEPWFVCSPTSFFSLRKTGKAM